MNDRIYRMVRKLIALADLVHAEADHFACECYVRLWEELHALNDNERAALFAVANIGRDGGEDRPGRFEANVRYGIDHIWVEHIPDYLAGKPLHDRLRAGLEILGYPVPRSCLCLPRWNGSSPQKSVAW